MLEKVAATNETDFNVLLKFFTRRLCTLFALQSPLTFGHIYDELIRKLKIKNKYFNIHTINFFAIVIIMFV